MLQPKRTKFRKAHKGRIKGKAKSLAKKQLMAKRALADFEAWNATAQQPLVAAQ